MIDLTNEQIQAILEGAPEGATHYAVNHENTVCAYLKKMCENERKYTYFWHEQMSGNWYEIDKIVGCIHSLSDLREILTLRQRVEELKAQALPNERGANRYGLDVGYFRNAIDRELNKPLINYKPDELARVFARLSKTADSEVIFEPEFSSKHNAKVAAKAVESVRLKTKNEDWEDDDLQAFLIEYAKQLREQGDD